MLYIANNIIITNITNNNITSGSIISENSINNTATGGNNIGKGLYTISGYKDIFRYSV